jgi:hypothetical protein
MTAKKRLHDGITFSKSTTDETENLMETPDELEI